MAGLQMPNFAYIKLIGFDRQYKGPGQKLIWKSEKTYYWWPTDLSLKFEPISITNILLINYLTLIMDKTKV